MSLLHMNNNNLAYKAQPVLLGWLLACSMTCHSGDIRLSTNNTVISGLQIKMDVAFNHALASRRRMSNSSIQIILRHMVYTPFMRSRSCRVTLAHLDDNPMCVNHDHGLLCFSKSNALPILMNAKQTSLPSFLHLSGT